MKLNINGTIYDYDMDRISIRDAMMLKTATGLNLRPFSAALTDLDPNCLQALAWLVQVKAGVTGADGAPIKVGDVDFDMVEFLEDQQPAETS